MTGLTKECPHCGGLGIGRCRMCSGDGCSVCLGSIDLEDYYDCDVCEATGRVPVLESELEAHGQERLPL